MADGVVQFDENRTTTAVRIAAQLRIVPSKSIDIEL
jgi:hypothetical protein